MKFLQTLLLSVLALLASAQNCQPGENLFQGKCYKIIPGCFKYESTTKCFQCANGFKLNSATSLCDRQQATQSPASGNSAPAVQGVPANVRLVHDFIIANNPEFRGLQYTNYFTVNTRLGQLITILFKFDRFTVLVTCEGDVKEIIYGNIRAEYDDPVKIISLIKQLYAEQMQGFEALQVQASENIYEIDFINEQRKRAVRVEVDRTKIDKFETSFKIGTFQYNRVYEMHINQYLKSINSTIQPSDLRNIRDYVNNQFIIYQYAEGSISASLGKCSFIINDFLKTEASYNYNYDEQFFKAYSTVIKLLPFQNFPPIKRVVRNMKIDGASLYSIDYSSGNRQYMNDIDFQIVIQVKNSVYKLLSLRLNYQYILEDVLKGTNQAYQNMVECFGISYIGSYCQNCQNYYEYLKQSDICFRVSGEKCQEYSKTSKKCLRCIKGYDIDEEGKCSASSVVIPYCDVIVNQTCRKCIEGYDLNGTGGCRELDPLCLMSRGSICAVCVPNFISVNGTCVREIPYCESYNTNGCVQCSYNYILRQRQPYSLCEPFVPDPLCIEYQNNLCQKCSEGYHLSMNSICYQKIQGCWNYDGYTGQCKSCKVGLRVFRNRCIELTDHVINCATDQQYKYCQQCSNGVGQYIIKNGRCQCQQGYYFLSDACVPRIQNCQYVNVNTFGCQICFEGFYLFSGKCVKPIEGCFTYNDEGQCVRCERGRDLYEEYGVIICRYSISG